MNKKYLLAGSTLVLSLALAACGTGGDTADSTVDTDTTGSDVASSTDVAKEDVTLHIAALESAYGNEVWDRIAEAYEAVNDNVTIDLTLEKNLEQVVRPNMQAGEYPDLMLLAVAREEGLTETLIKEKGIEEITDVLDMNVFGEDVKVKDKMLPGFTDTLVTNPYGDNKTYLAPMFYSPTGLFYNKALFEEKGWEIPETWDQMWTLGDQAAEEGISLFTYPVAGYLDTLVNSLLYSSGGPDFYDKAMNYEEGIWVSEEATEVFDTLGKLGEYTHPTTVANANPNDYIKNQQLLLDNEALFMPNGTWVVGEMAEAPRADGFEWAMTPAPAIDGGDTYAYTFFEQMWIPSEAENIDAAKEFMTFVYSDKAAEIFAEAGAMQPIEGMVEKMSPENQVYYNIYDEGTLPALGGFASTKPVPGVSMKETLFFSMDSVVSGNTSVEQWQKDVEEVSGKLRDAKE